ncbi:serine hydrolase domain-containing protein [Arenicella chitinivorans]|nr:serine hydrolase [Arenicella chitinivorans]
MQKNTRPADNLFLSQSRGQKIDNDEFVRLAYAGELPAEIQVKTFGSTEHLFPTRCIAKGPKIAPLVEHKDHSENAQFSSHNRDYTIDEYIACNRVTGLLILKDSQIILERYQHGINEKSRWMSMSMAKSISTTLVGVAIKQGYIKSVNDPLTDYLPELVNSTYDKVTIEQLLQMTSGARWNEDHTNPLSERREVLELQIAQQPGAILRYMATLPQVAKPGCVWNYSTGETHVVGALLKAATGKYLADYLSETLWSKLGMESDSHWWLESPDGLEIAGSGITATLRDYGRFGLFMMNDGIVNGERLLPEGWVKQATTPFKIGDTVIPYGYMWWAIADQQGSFNDGAFSARGIFGQRIYINPKKNIVIVVWSARPKPMNTEQIIDNEFFSAATDFYCQR